MGELPIAKQISVNGAYRFTATGITGLAACGYDSHVFSGKTLRNLSILTGRHALNILEAADHVSRITETCHLRDRIQLQVGFLQQRFDMIDPHPPDQIQG